MVLQSIRDRLSGILAFFILGILVIPFAFVGVSSYFSSGTENLVARVNDTEITVNEFTQSFSTYRNRMRSILGQAFDPVDFETAIERRKHLDSLIDQEILRQAVQGLGLDVDDAYLAQRITSDPAFQLEGVFSQEVYRNRLTAAGYTVESFEREERERLIMAQLPVGVLGSSIATRTELAGFVALQDQTRHFRSVAFEPVVDESAPDPDEDQVLAWYEAHPDQFQSEELVTIEYLELDAVSLDTGIEPEDEFLRQRFDQQQGRFISPEQRRVSHILIEASATADDAVLETAKQEAQSLADRARAGEDFADLAREFSDDIGSAAGGGELGWIEPDVMSDSFEDAMYALSLDNPVSDPVQTAFGWHVIYLHEIQESTGMSFEEARPVLIAEHHAEESEREFIDKADRLIDLIYEDPTTLEAAALDLGLEVRSEGPFGRFGGDGVAANPEVVKAAFSDLVLVEGTASDPVDLGDNHLLVLRVREHFPAALKPLDEVRDQIVQSIRVDREREAARQAAEAMLAALVDGEGELDGLAEASGLEVVETESTTRRGFVPDRIMIEQVFGLEAPGDNGPRRAVVESSTGYALVELLQVNDGNLETVGPGAEQYRRQIANAAASIEVTGLLQQLRDQADIEVYEERLR